MFWLKAIWDWFFSTAGLAGAICVGASLVAVFTPAFLTVWFPGIRRMAIEVAIVAGVFSATSAYFYKQGVDYAVAQWRVSVDQEITDSEKARADAELAVRNSLPDSVRIDQCNRDNWRPGQQAC